AAGRLRAAGHDVDIVSVGSTPTALFADDLTGITEVRAGVYVFQDLMMAGLGVCAQDDIAISVLVSVIGHQASKGWIITDGGWMALSRDRGTSVQPVDQLYGVVCDASGQPLDDLLMLSGSQEHGIIGRRKGDARPLPDLPVGTLLRILPNHACATAAQYERYQLVEGASPLVVGTEGRVNHW
ncbi:MAG: DSD1 family PLP-dependent enzyme, partial [Gemmatimonadetes bacterium]|nr:DSD1 family PLP-dependent enzyme [Gemmatimonadota bacterium]